MPGVNQDQSDKDSEPFVEIDPTGRYGRYSELLGSGAVKKVYRAFDQEEGIEVAWNQVKLRNFSNDPSMIDRLYSEVRLLRSLTNKNIISLYNVWRDEEHNTLNFITEVCTSGNLREYRKKHRDLNCSNVFVNGNTGQYRLRLVIWEWLRLWGRAIQRIQSSGHRNSWRRSCTRNITPSSSTYTHSGCVC
ncbi:hypothetical protein E1A91_D13G162800v1 [Gossypium mustelinum]|uniref:non-specific serine/threonine protein kinase n=2 Tax=Gossypium TaxID=3633 RepID=A0A5D2S582_GOSMU|nr:hypothetical protein ES332_D13G169600v1 [Gossypium tomentosum]TYI47295.1 hypothetical protein E1A91_D13G162800v1 [Gossypium mustelinum]